MRVSVALLLPKWIGEEGIYYAEICAWSSAAVLLIISYMILMADQRIVQLDAQALGRIVVHLAGKIRIQDLACCAETYLPLIRTVHGRFVSLKNDIPDDPLLCRQESDLCRSDLPWTYTIPLFQ